MKKEPTTIMGKLSVYLSDLTKKSWTVSFDKIEEEDTFEDDYFFLVSKELYKYLSTWKPKLQRWKPIGKCIVALSIHKLLLSDNNNIILHTAKLSQGWNLLVSTVMIFQFKNYCQLTRRILFYIL